MDPEYQRQPNNFYPLIYAAMNSKRLRVIFLHIAYGFKECMMEIRALLKYILLYLTKKFTLIMENIALNENRSQDC